jgi:protein-S-isoprenylcysteine O-methyltransferase Ste14
MTFMTLENRIPPPAIGLLAGAAMWGIARITPLVEVPYLQQLALMAAVIGVGFVVAGILSFIRNKTTVNPLTPQKATSLVTSGVYRITRNPMYVGMLFILVSWGLFLSSAWALIGPLVFLLYMNRFQIEPEERALAALFGSDYSDYKKRVRRWL